MNSILLATLLGDWTSDEEVKQFQNDLNYLNNERSRIEEMEKAAARDEMGVLPAYEQDYTVAKKIRLAQAIEGLSVDLLGFEGQTGVEMEIEVVFDKTLNITTVLGKYKHDSDAAVVRLSLGKIEPCTRVDLLSNGKYAFIWPAKK